MNLKDQNQLENLIRDFLGQRLSKEDHANFLYDLKHNAQFAKEANALMESIELLEMYKQSQLRKFLHLLEKKQKRRTLYARIFKLVGIFILFLSLPFYLQLGFQWKGTVDVHLASLVEDNLEETTITAQYKEKPKEGSCVNEIKRSITHQVGVSLLKINNKDLVRLDNLLKEQEKETYKEQADLAEDRRESSSKEIRKEDHLFAMKKNSIRWRGQVLLEQSLDYNNLKIFIDSIAYPVDDQGSFNVEIQPGEHVIRFMAKGYEVHEENRLITEDNKELEKITLVKKPLLFAHTLKKSTLRIQGLDEFTEEGLPIKLLIGKKDYETDENGHLIMEFDPGDYKIFAFKSGYNDSFHKVTLKPGEATVLNLMMVSSVTQLQTISSSTRFVKPFKELDTSLEIVQHQSLTNNVSNALVQYLDKIPGVNIMDRQVNIRGGAGYSFGAGSRVLVLLDGLPALQKDAAFPVWDFMPMENIRKMEVIKGASSALYGSSGLNGVIDLQTQFHQKSKISTFGTFYLNPKDKAKKWWGSDSTSTPFISGLSFVTGHKLGRLDLVVGGYLYKENSYLQNTGSAYVRNHLKTQYRTKNDKMKFGLNANFQTGKNDQFFIWKNSQAGAYQAFDGSITNNVNYRIVIDPYFEFKGSDNQEHTIKTRFFHSNNKQANSFANQGNKSNQMQGEYRFYRNFQKPKLLFTSGLTGSHTTSDGALYGDTLHTAADISAFAHLSRSFGDRLRLSGGMRLESNFISGSDRNAKLPRPVFRVGANLKLWENNFLRMSWGQGYRMPSIAEKFITTNIGLMFIYPNESLQAERGWTSEIGFKQGIEFNHWKGFVDISGFWMEYKNMMEFVFQQWGNPSDPLIGLGFASKNIGHTRIRGFEAGLKTKGSYGDFSTTLNGGYTFVDPRYISEDTLVHNRLLKYRFKHSFKFDVGFKYKKISLGFVGQYNSHIKAIDPFFEDQHTLAGFGLGDLRIKEYRENNDKGSFVLDAKLAVKPMPKWTFSLVGKNILNREYSLRPALLEAPASISLRAAYNIR